MLARSHRPVLFRGPDGELVPVGVEEMEAPSAGEGVDRLDDLRAGVLEPLLGRLEVVRIEDDERHARLS